MIALKGYEQNKGFSVMSTDELYFINGGSATTGQKVGYSVARVVAEIVFIGNDCPDLKEAWAREVSGFKD